MSASGEGPICPLCLRRIPPGVPQSRHHLVPRLKGGGGGAVVLLHALCHKELHVRFSEAELARHFATPEAIRASGRMADFLDWVAKRPPGFTSRSAGQGRGRPRKDKTPP